MDTKKLNRLASLINEELADDNITVIADGAEKNGIYYQGFRIVRDNSIRVNALVYIDKSRTTDDLEAEAKFYAKIIRADNMHFKALEAKVIEEFDSISKESILKRTKPVFRNIRNEDGFKKRDVVYLPWYGDIIIAFSYLLNTDEDGGESSIMITEKMLKDYNLTEIELLKSGDDKLTDGANFHYLDNMLMCAFGVSFENEESDTDRSMIVVTNGKTIDGASSMLTIRNRQTVSNMYDNKPYYILPSSRHEVICVPEMPNVGVKDLVNLVHEVNETVLDEKDFLSNMIFRVYKDLSVTAIQ